MSSCSTPPAPLSTAHSKSFVSSIDRPVRLRSTTRLTRRLLGRRPIDPTEEPTMNKPSIVFAHGIWADGSSFSKLIPALRADGHQVLSTQNNLDTLKGDVAAVIRALGRVASPAILVGHSWGGSVITAAGTDARVAGLVYLAALAPDGGETSQTAQDQFPVTDVFAHVEIADGRLWLRPDGIECFAGDLSDEEQQIVWATQGAAAADLFQQKLEGAAWRTKPSWYVVAKNDRTVQPELQRFLA